MQYLMLVYGAESEWAKMTPEQQATGVKAYQQFTEDIKASGKWVGSNRLTPVSSATTIRVRDGKRVVTDGPYVETKEQLGGYYLIEAKDLDEALAIASKCPAAHHGTVELRPVWAVGATQAQRA